MKKEMQASERQDPARFGSGPSAHELEVLNHVVSELKTFLESRSATTINNIYIGVRGDKYSGQMLLSKGA